MTLNMMVGGISQPGYAKTGDRPASGAEPGGAGFEEALAAKSRRKAPEAPPANADARSSWSPRSYGSALGYGADGIGTDEAAAGDAAEELLAWAEAELPDMECEVPAAPDDALPGEPQAVLPDTSLPDAAPAVLPDAVAAEGETDDVVRAAVPADDEALAAARQQQSHAATEARGAPAAANPAAAAQPPADRQGEQRGRTPPASAAPAAPTKADLHPVAPAGLRPETTDGAPANAADKPAARFVPAREQWSQGDRQPKSQPQGNAGKGFEGQFKVVGYSAALAPSPAAMPLLGNTSASVVAAIEGEHTWRAAGAESGALAGQRSQTLSTGVNTLRIQLQPVELGMVTARLSASGTQLSVEIQVESNDARQKLANDSDAILKALRGLGFDIDKVTIQQAPQPSQPSSPAAQQGGGGREHFAPNQQAQGEADNRRQGGDRSSNARDGERAGTGPGEAPGDRAGSSLYI